MAALCGGADFGKAACYGSCWSGPAPGNPAVNDCCRETTAATAKNPLSLANVRCQETGSGYDRYGEEKLPTRLRFQS